MTTQPGWYTISPDASDDARVRLDARGTVTEAKRGRRALAVAALANEYCRTPGELATLAVHSGRRVSA